MSDYKVFKLKAFKFQCGTVMPDAALAYQTYGTLNSDRSNAVILGVPVVGTHKDAEVIHLQGRNRAINPNQHFIVIPNMFGNGLSSSPSNAPEPFNSSNFPPVTIYDNVMAQHQLVTKELGLSKFKLAAGFSMGGQQAYHWAAMFPDMIENVAPICSSAKCSAHNWLFLQGLVAALTADPEFNKGRYERNPTVGMRALSAVWSGWMFSQEFYRHGKHLELGLKSPIDVIKFAEARFSLEDANNLLLRIRAWQNSDISANQLYNRDLNRALQAITARAIVLPSATDQYFWSGNSMDEVELIKNADLRVIPSLLGHSAGSGIDADDRAFIDRALKELID